MVEYEDPIARQWQFNPNGSMSEVATPQRFTPVTNNRVGAYLTARPLLQIVWFSFVGTVAITVGVIAMANRSEPQNLVGGVIAILFGLVSLMAAYYVYQKRR